MIVKKEYYNIKCDCCGSILDEETFWDEIEGVEFMLDTCGWKATEDGKHYCTDCYEYDSDGNLIIKNGKKYDSDGYEIGNRHFNYIEVGEWMTLTQFRMEIERNTLLFRCMVGTLYKGMLADDLRQAHDWFDELLSARKETWEWDCYQTFLKHRMFNL